MTKPKGQNTINYVPDYPSTPSSNSPSNTPQPAAPRQSPTPRTPTKKRKLPQLPQHATQTPPSATSTPEITPPSATSTPEINIRRKKPKLNDNSPYPSTFPSNSTTPSTNYTINLFGPNPNHNMQASLEDDPYDPNNYTPVS